jgi:outer membrane protein assembly factor BamD
MKLAKLVVLVLSAGLIVTGCGHGKKKVGPETRRDNELMQQGTKELTSSHYIVGRLLLNTLITTYPDSPYVPMAKLTIADSFYREGTTEALAQAEVEYKDFANFFPTHPLADDALLQVAYINMRQILAPNRDITAAKKAEKALLAILQRFPNTDLKPEIEERLKEVRNHLADHNVDVARLQMKREQLKGAKNRLKDVADEYPDYTKMDEVLYRLGTVLFKLEEPEEAAKYLARLVRQYPDSQYRDRAAEMIENMGHAVPESEPVELAKAPTQDSPGFFGSVLGTVLNLISNPNMHVPHNGVLLKEDGTAEELFAMAEQYSKPATVVTPESSVVGVGPTGPIAPGAQGGAHGKQTVAVGANEKNPAPPEAGKKENKKRQEKKNDQKKK